MSWSPPDSGPLHLPIYEEPLIRVIGMRLITFKDANWVFQIAPLLLLDVHTGVSNYVIMLPATSAALGGAIPLMHAGRPIATSAICQGRPRENGVRLRHWVGCV